MGNNETDKIYHLNKTIVGPENHGFSISSVKKAYQKSLKNTRKKLLKSMTIHENQWEFMKYGRALRTRPFLMDFNRFSWIVMDFNCFFLCFSMIFDMLSLHYWFRTHGFQDPQLFYGPIMQAMSASLQQIALIWLCIMGRHKNLTTSDKLNE